ncbi:hypothetical protein FHS27_004495 [Rhodopirellula rubra]|uniref:DUF1269 domain-containing protein n=1 Tax=Aporhodopirellula rubra TaxID=980271 RepID=A0A7W5E309_9BACT|nr:DUF1269 domain-containing protein [Aporhodopirellula rubra]MBB3208663.1 hypothetical protein [Aporhodopirellula rubra]
MSKDCLIAEFAGKKALHTALEVLEKAGYGPEEVSVISTPDEIERHVPRDRTQDMEDSPPAEKTTGAATLAGGAVGAVLGAGTMIGPLLVAGPIVGMAVGAASGGLFAAVKSLQISEDVALRYEEHVIAGGTLVMVIGESIKLNDAERGLKTCNPETLKRFEIS